MDSKIMKADIHDASFSSYLNTSAESFVLKLSDSARPPVNLEKTKTKEGDICVFGAEKYFSVKLDGEKSKALNINTPSRPDITEKVQLPGTVSISSEVGSNSQDALPQPSLRNSSQGRQKKVSRKWLLAGFLCNRLCSDDNSIFVRKNVPERAVRGQESMKQSIQVVPSPVKRPPQRILENIEEHSGMQRLNVNNLSKEERIEEEEEEEEGEPEVSGSKIIDKGDIQWYLERKLSMLTWDAIPKSQNATTSSASSHIYADIESEGSSDLFEIDNLSVSRKIPYDLSFTNSTMTPYSPSEKSVVWSVATASATDFSAVSDYYKMKLTARPEGPFLATKAGEAAETKSLPDRGTKKPSKQLIGVQEPQSSKSCRKFIEKANEEANPSNSESKDV